MFRLRKIQKEIKTAEKAQGIADRISNCLLAAQRKAADFLNRKTARWSPQKTKTMLILFCLVTGNISLYIAGTAILSANGPPKTFRVQRLAIPAPLKNTFRVDSTSKKANPP